MLRLRYLLVTLISITVIAVIVLLIAAGILPPRVMNQTRPMVDTQEPVMERVDPGSDAGESITAAMEQVMPQETPQQDAQSLLENHCARCHLVNSFEQVQQSRANWKKTLEQMEEMGVALEDDEKVILLNFLANEAGP